MSYSPWHFSTDKLVRYWLATVRIELALVADVPGATSGTVVVANGRADGVVLCALACESITIHILGVTDRVGGGNRIALEDRVGAVVEVRVDAQAEKMLVVCGIVSFARFVPGVRSIDGEAKNLK